MAIGFKLWSESSPSVKASMKPVLELRSWNSLTDEEKTKVIRHLLGMGWLKDYEITVNCIRALNDEYKVNTFGKEFFEHGGPHISYSTYDECCTKAATRDLFSILKNQDENVVMELLSLYARSLIKQHYLNGEVSEDDLAEAYSVFDRFANAINDIFDHFAINRILTRQSFVPKQEKIVNEYVTEPTFKSIAGKEWQPVQKEFSDAMVEYHKGTSKSYSNSITHLVSALQAFLQIKVNGKLGKGDIAALITKGISDGKLPDDELSKKVIKGINSTIMDYRQKQSDAHPKKEYANEKSVRLVLNVIAVFIQHCNN